MGLPVLIGAGVGGLTSALRGKNILKGAALGGAMGGVGGGLNGLLQGGSFLEGAGLSGLGGLSGATSEAVSQGAGGLLGTGAANSASLIPTIAESTVPIASESVAPSIIGNTIESSPELTMGADGVLRNNAYFQNIAGNPIYTGNGSMLDKFKMGAESLGSNFSSMMPNNIGVDNLLGAGQIAMGQPTRAAPIASQPIQVGQAPSPEGYAQFMQQYYSPYKKQRTDLGV